MAALDEQLVEEWLNRSGFFTIRGVKAGLSEMDLLAIRVNGCEPEYWHLEVQVSFNPMGYIGGDNNARKRTKKEVAAGIDAWVEKKFRQEKVLKRRDELVPRDQSKWKEILVHAETRHPEERDLIKAKGVTLISYYEIIEQLLLERKSTSSSAASGIVDIVRYMKMNAPR